MPTAGRKGPHVFEKDCNRVLVLKERIESERTMSRARPSTAAVIIKVLPSVDRATSCHYCAAIFAPMTELK